MRTALFNCHAESKLWVFPPFSDLEEVARIVASDEEGMYVKRKK